MEPHCKVVLLGLFYWNVTNLKDRFVNCLIGLAPSFRNRPENVYSYHFRNVFQYLQNCFIWDFFQIKKNCNKNVAFATFENWVYVIAISRTSFKVNLHSIACLNVKELFARTRRHSWSLSDSNGIWIHTHLFRKRTLNQLAKLASL